MIRRPGRVTGALTISRTVLLAVALVAGLCSCLLFASSSSAGLVRHLEGSFASEGPGAGSFYNAQAVAVDQATGDLFVYEGNFKGEGSSGAIYKFSENGEPAEFTGLKADLIAGVPAAGYNAGKELAVSQAGPTKGDLYVATGQAVEIYSSATGEKLGELSSEPAGGPSWIEPCGVAVDTSGRVYVGLAGHAVNRYAPAGEVVQNSDWDGSLWGLPYEPCNLAAGSGGEAYVVQWEAGPVRRYGAGEFNTEGAAAPGGSELDAAGSTLAVDPSSGDVLVDENAQVSEFDSAGHLLAVFAGGGAEPIALSAGIGVAGDGTVYVADDSRQRVDIFSPAEAVPPPIVVIEPATGAETGEPTFHGSVNPQGHDTSWWFEFSLDGGDSWASTPKQDAGSGNAPVPVEAARELPGQQIMVRLVARSDEGGEVISASVSLETPARSCPNGRARGEQGAGYLPDCRAYELVSPVDKNGGNVIAESSRSRVAASGDAVTFASLSGFADASGTGIAVDYLAERSPSSDPGGTGWSTHAISPPQSAVPPQLLLAGGTDPRYVGPFSPDADTGVFQAYSPLGEEPFVADVPNLYLRTDLDHPGSGSYQLITRCPACESEAQPLPPFGPYLESLFRYSPALAGASPDLSHVIFESYLALTSDTPPQPPACDLAGSPASEPTTSLCRIHVYEWEHGTVRLAGILPNGTPADLSFAGDSWAGQGFVAYFRPNAISDGSDGHTRVFFTQPTSGSGESVEEMQQTGKAVREQQAVAQHETSPSGGRLYVRVDGSVTDEVDISERTDCGIEHTGETPKVPPACTGAPAPGPYGPADFLGASSDGTRVFFSTPAALTDDVPTDSSVKVYMYDAGKPASDPHNLTAINVGSSGGFRYLLGFSGDGHYMYFTDHEQIVPGAPKIHGPEGVFLWHDGVERYIATVPPNTVESDEFATDSGQSPRVREARVAPDGRHVLFPNAVPGDCQISGVGFPGGSPDCRELYLYDADADSTVCVSCRAGHFPHAMASDLAFNGLGGSKFDPLVVNSNALSADGRYAFFNTREALAPRDTNGAEDAYVYDSVSGQAHLLSSGKGSSPSWFVDAASDGSNAFFVTSQPLLRWDSDQAYDLYDARIGGGFPEPAVACQGEACASGSSSPEPAESPESLAFAGSETVVSGAGTAVAPPPPAVKPKPKPKPKPQCKRKKRDKRNKRRCHPAGPHRRAKR